MGVPIGICCNGSKPPFEGGSLGSNPSVPVKSDLYFNYLQMQKLIELLNEYEREKTKKRKLNANSFLC